MLIISATNRSMLDRPEQILYNPRSAGPLAQWLEQATHNRLVAGSNPAGATKFSQYIHTLKPPFTVAFLLPTFRVAMKWRWDFTAIHHLPPSTGSLLTLFGLILRLVCC